MQRLLPVARTDPTHGDCQHAVTGSSERERHKDQVYEVERPQASGSALRRRAADCFRSARTCTTDPKQTSTFYSPPNRAPSSRREAVRLGTGAGLNPPQQPVQVSNRDHEIEPATRGPRPPGVQQAAPALVGRRGSARHHSSCVASRVAMAIIRHSWKMCSRTVRSLLTS